MRGAESTCALCGLPCRQGDFHKRFAAPRAPAAVTDDRAANEPFANGTVAREAGPAPVESDLSFCCAGCMNVYEILSESGLVQEGVDLRETDIFRRSLELGLIASGSSRIGAKAEGLHGSDGSTDRSSERSSGGSAEPPIPSALDSQPTHELTLRVSGMWCASCAWLIEHALQRERGVSEAGVSFASDLAVVRYRPMELAPDRIRSRIESLGYATSDPAEEDARAAQEKRRALWQLGLAAFLWGNVMTLNVVVYVGYYEKLPPDIASKMPPLLMALSAPAVFYCAWPILRLAWLGLKQGIVRAETLLAIGILTSWGYSAVETLRGGQHVYFDTACAIVMLVLAGKWIERTAKARAAAAFTRLDRLMPNKARILVAGEERFVNLAALGPGDEFVVKAGERFPADGIVITGESEADEALLTGESAPVPKRPGDTAISGSLNAGSVLRLRATNVGDASTLRRLIGLVEHALSSRTEMEKLADRISRVFVPSVAVIALATFIGWRWFGGLELEPSILRAVAVLVIACPCALGIAAPLAITTAVGAASRRGILVRESRVLETIEKVDVLVLDKTGTVTDGELSILEVPEEHLRLLASLEAYSEHAVGRALVAHARALDLALTPADDVMVHRGLGISGIVQGQELVIGRRSLVGAVDPALAGRAAAMEETGGTLVYYGWGGRARGLILLGSRIRAGAEELVTSARRDGIRVIVLSGDTAAATAWAAARVGADEYHGEVSPDGKVEFLRRMSAEGRIVAMVGDGVNDAPALAAADLGMAMGSGTDIAKSAAAVTLVQSSLLQVLEVFRLSRRTLRIVRQNFFWAFAYNVAGIALAAAGRLNPIFAASAMVISSVCVIANSARMGWSQDR